MIVFSEFLRDGLEDERIGGAGGGACHGRGLDEIYLRNLALNTMKDDSEERKHRRPDLGRGVCVFIQVTE